jgi:hypothetical protein
MATTKPTPMRGPTPDVPPREKAEKPTKAARPVERTYLACTALPGCDFKTKRYPERDLGTARKELGEHAVARHAEQKRVRIVIERREEPV